MSAEDVQKTDTFIRKAEARIDALRDKGVDTKSLGACLALARCWANEGSRNHAEAICEEVLNVAERIALEPGRTTTPSPVAPELTPTGARINDVEHRMREHFSRELGQVLAAKPWNLERRTEDHGPGAGIRDTLEQVRAQVEELRRLMQEGGAAGVSLEEVKSVLAGELEANGLASKIDRLALKPGSEPAVPPFVQRLDGRLMQIAHAQDRVADRLGALERSLGRLVEQSIHERLPPDSGSIPAPAHAPHAPREATGSWLQDLDAETTPVGAAANPPETVAANATPVALDPPSALDEKGGQADDRADARTSESDAMEAPTLVVARPGGSESYSTASPARTTGPLQRVDDEHLRAVIASQMALHQPETSTTNLAQPTSEQSDAEFIKRLARVLPEVLRLPGVHESVLALVAVEAATHPGALAELSGVRAFLRRELLRQVDEIKKSLVIGEPV
ncbi:MAG: hypothetical protein H0X45_14805 [Planctomycetes bacterium]|nr:hypothetical protein [Planctomycetota bacterium]